MSLLGLQFRANSLRETRLGPAFVFCEPQERGEAGAPISAPELKEGGVWGRGARAGPRGTGRTPGVDVTPALPGKVGVGGTV